MITPDAEDASGVITFRFTAFVFNVGIKINNRHQSLSGCSIIVKAVTVTTLSTAMSFLPWFIGALE
jgi:hypothetical protein